MIFWVFPTAFQFWTFINVQNRFANPKWTKNRGACTPTTPNPPIPDIYTFVRHSPPRIGGGGVVGEHSPPTVGVIGVRAPLLINSNTHSSLPYSYQL